MVVAAAAVAAAVPARDSDCEWAHAVPVRARHAVQEHHPDAPIPKVGDASESRS